MTAEEYIETHTKKGSNAKGGWINGEYEEVYQPWISTDNALEAIRLAKEEAKGQMTKDAVECFVGTNGNMTHKLLCFSPRNQQIALDDALNEINVGDKVKLVIIKQEEE